MIKKVFTVLLGLLVAGTMISVDCSDAAVKRNRVRPRTVSKPVTQPAPTATQQTTAAPAAAATATAPKTTTTAPAATVTQPTTAQGMPYGQTMAAPQSQGSGMGSALLGVGAGLAGGYLLNSALSGSDATAATAAAPAPAAAPASPVANLLGYDTANYCTQLSQGNADVMQQCTAAEAAATAAFRQCVAMSTGLNGIGSYDALLRCLRGTPAAQ